MDDGDARTPGGEEEIRKLVDEAEPPPDSREWADETLKPYKLQLIGAQPDLNKVFELPCLKAAAVLSIEAPDEFASLREELKNAGVLIGDWAQRIHAIARRLEKQREHDEKAEARRKRAAGGVPHRNPRPQIPIVPGGLPAMVDQAERVLVANAEPLKLFQRANEVVRVIVMNPEAAARAKKRDGLERPEGAVIIHQVNATVMREMLDLLIEWTYTTVEGEERIKDCPTRVAVTYLSRFGLQKLPLLTGVIEAPILRPDGTTLDATGYDRDTGLYLDCDDDWPAIPQDPSRADAETALKELLEPFAEFPFVSEQHRSVLVAGILTALQRRLLEDSPLFGFSANVQRTGKSLLVDSIGILATGRKPAAAGMPKEIEELRKAITSTLREGHLIANLDNIVHPLDSPDLARAITQNPYKDRLLGTNTNARLPNNVMWTATGNNLTFRGDMPSRALLSMIDANRERPEERTFKIENLKGHLLIHRKRLVTAALTILRAYRVAGCPRQKVSAWGGFEHWSKEIREPLVWLELTDPYLSRDQIVVNDPDRELVTDILHSWTEVFGESAKLAREVIASATNHPELEKTLLMVAAHKDNPEKIDPRRLGHWLAKTEGRIIDGRRLIRDHERQRATAWRVSSVSSVGSLAAGRRTSAENGHIYPADDIPKDIPDGIYVQKKLSESDGLPRNPQNPPNSLTGADDKSADGSNTPPVDSQGSEKLHDRDISADDKERF
jgi:hypothetical protein